MLRFLIFHLVPMNLRFTLFSLCYVAISRSVTHANLNLIFWNLAFLIFCVYFCQCVFFNIFLTFNCVVHKIINFFIKTNSNFLKCLKWMDFIKNKKFGFWVCEIHPGVHFKKSKNLEKLLLVL